MDPSDTHIHPTSLHRKEKGVEEDQAGGGKKGNKGEIEVCLQQVRMGEES